MKAVAGEGVVREQVASKWSERATCRGYHFCCCYYITNLLCLYFWVLGWAYFPIGWAYLTMGWAYLTMGWAYLTIGWAYFRERKIRPPLSLSSHLSSSPMCVFPRDYSVSWTFSKEIGPGIHSLHMCVIILVWNQAKGEGEVTLTYPHATWWSTISEIRVDIIRTI